jgi:hypothetical protein
LSAEKLESIHAALLRLLCLAFYVAVMTMLGYRIRRPRTRRPGTRPLGAPTPVPAAQPALTPAAPAQPRRHHLYLDRESCLAALAGINSQVATAAPHPAAAADPPPSAPADQAPSPIAAIRPPPPRLPRHVARPNTPW